MLVTVVGTLLTQNLAVGVVAGVLTASVAFARRVAQPDELTYAAAGIDAGVLDDVAELCQALVTESLNLN